MIGYGVSTVIRPLVALVVTPWHVLVVRVGADQLRTVFLWAAVPGVFASWVAGVGP